MKKVLSAIVVSVVGVWLIDYFSHLFFSSPMETTEYFWAKATFYFIFSLIFLFSVNLSKREFLKVLIGGVVVASLWGMYYNVFPDIFGYYTYGIALEGLSFLGMAKLGTGIAFGSVHIIAFVGGYYASRVLASKLKN